MAEVGLPLLEDAGAGGGGGDGGLNDPPEGLELSVGVGAGQVLGGHDFQD